MLLEIYCETFGKDKRVPFDAGLNIIQGDGNSEDKSGNSIGKTSMLKIIDYAFGGEYYGQSNEDIIRHIGHHRICFTHIFNGEPYYFCRETTKNRKVWRCSDRQYHLEREITIEEFCKWLVEQYKLESLNLRFREIVGLYSRIWNKPNKEVSRPLFNYNAQPVNEAILALVKLFEEYGKISDLDEQRTYLKKRETAFREAVKYHLVSLPSKKESESIKSELREVQIAISRIKSNVLAVGYENVVSIDERTNELYFQRSNLLKQLSRVRRALKRCEDNVSCLSPVNSTALMQLKEYFPEVNMRKIQEVQDFHQQLNQILLDELNDEKVRLLERVKVINAELKKNDIALQTLTGLPTQAAEGLEQLQALLSRQERMKNQLEQYDDKAKTAAQIKDINDQLSKVLNEIEGRIEPKINEKLIEYSKEIAHNNSKAPVFHFENGNYQYGVVDNTGTGKAYTDLLLFDLTMLALTKLPILIHDSFLFNNIDDRTKISFIKLYNRFSDKQIFISLDNLLESDDDEANKILYKSNRLYLSGNRLLYGRDWRVDESSTENN